MPRNLFRGGEAGARLASNFVVKRFGKAYRKDDILSDIKPIRRTIGDENYTIYPFKGCLWQGTMINLFLVRADGYDNFIQYLRLYIHDKSFKDTLDGLSIYLLSKRPPKAVALTEAALKEAYVNIGYGGVNKVNACLLAAILTSS
jgi:hypothetical protein